MENEIVPGVGKTLIPLPRFAIAIGSAPKPPDSFPGLRQRRVIARVGNEKGGQFPVFRSAGKKKISNTFRN